MAARILKHLISKVLVLSIPEFARKANLSDKGVRNLFDGKHKPRERTRRDVLKAINDELVKIKKKPVGLRNF